MRVLVAAVGRVRGDLAPPLQEYERRARRYFSFETTEVREFSSRRATGPREVRREEGSRLLARVPDGLETLALHREGEFWSSERLARYLHELSVRASPGAAFLIGGAFGLPDSILQSATHQLSLSGFTLPHEVARLVLTEQIYRAGTILRGEPYHKGRD